MFIVEKDLLGKPTSIPGRTVSISFHVHAFMKGMNPYVSLSFSTEYVEVRMWSLS